MHGRVSGAVTGNLEERDAICECSSASAALVPDRLKLGVSRTSRSDLGLRVA